MDLPPDRETPSHSFEKHETQHLRSLLEAVIFASPEPVTVRQLAAALQESEERIQDLVEQSDAEFQRPEHGVVLHKAGTGYRMGTKPEHHEDLKEILRRLRPRAPLSLSALQTLAIIAYKQPISAPEIQSIRRVEGAGVLETLLKRKLIVPAGHKRDGRHAVLYRTTDLFLKDFGLQSLEDLPALQQFTELRTRL